LFTYVIIWIKVPSIEVTITGQEHILRIFTLSLLSWFAYMINKIYIQNLKDNEQQLQYQQLMATLSSDMLGTNLVSMNTKLIEAFKKMGIYSNLQRIYLIKSNTNMQNLNYAIEWCHPKISSTIDKHKSHNLGSFNYIHELDIHQEEIYVLQHHNLPLLAKDERLFMKAQHTKTTIFLPIRLDHNIIGLLGMDSIYHHKEPNNSELKLI